MAPATAKDRSQFGRKHHCACGTRYYQFGKVTPHCPSCSAPPDDAGSPLFKAANDMPPAYLKAQEKQRESLPVPPDGPRA